MLAGAAGLAARATPSGAANRAAGDHTPDLLRAAWADRIDTLDPYRSLLRTTLMVAHELYDCLLDRDPDTLRLRPLLAESMRQIDDLTLAFRLRPGVWFHDGSPLGAEDVVATVRSVLSDTALAIPSNYTWLAGARARGELDVELRLSQTFPSAAEYIAMVLPIMPRSVAEPDGRARLAASPVGTGPYRFEQAAADGTLHLAAFETPVARSPKGVPAIRRLQIGQPLDPLAPFAALQAGKADWVWPLTSAQMRTLDESGRWLALRGESFRVAYLAMDAAGRSGAPFRLQAVRRALCHAVDRAGLLAAVVSQGGRVAMAPCAPIQFACDPSAAAPLPYDPTRARALLAEAGYPDGFATEMVTSSRPAVAATLAGQLAACGIRAEVVWLPVAEAVARAAAGRAPLFLGTWGSSSVNDISAFLPPLFGGGSLDLARDGVVSALIAAAAGTVDAERRRGLYRQAIARIADAALLLPLFVDAATYGIDRRLAFRPAPDELPRFYRAAWR